MPTSSESPGWYSVEVNESGQNLTIHKHNDLSSSSEGSELASESLTYSSGDWVWVEIGPPTGSDDEIEVDAYELDEGSLERGESIGSVSTTDDDYAGERGVGATVRSSSDTGTVIDWIRILDD